MSGNSLLDPAGRSSFLSFLFSFYEEAKLVVYSGHWVPVCCRVHSSAAALIPPCRPLSTVMTGFSLDLRARSSFLLLRLSLLPLSHFCIDHFSLRLRHLTCLNYSFHLSVYSFVIKSQITLSGVVLQMNAVSSLLFSLPGLCQLSLH